MSEEDRKWERLINGLRNGDDQIVTDFYKQHWEKLRAIADQRMASYLRRRENPSDVVQSAFRTFFRRTGEGRFQFQDCEQLWSLICAITLNKVRQRVRFHGRDKRRIAAESHPDSGPDPGRTGMAAFPTRGLSPEAAAEFADQFHALLDSLDQEQQQIVQLKIDDLTNEEIAAKLEMSDRTVGRILNRMKQRFERMFGD